MAKLVFGMNQSLDGYVDLMAFAPSPTLFRHFIEEAQGQVGSVYGRRMYEVMRYWDDDHPEWDADEHAFAAAWRNQPKWVASRSLKSVGPNAKLVEDNLECTVRELKAERDGEIEVAGPDLAHSLTKLGLIDEYRIYLHPVVLGHGKPYFAGPRPPLRLIACDRIDEAVIRLTYAPACSRDCQEGIAAEVRALARPNCGLTTGCGGRSAARPAAEPERCQKEPDMPIHVKRAYDRPERTDGYRVLVDKLWPRGLTKEAARIDEWAKAIAPTTILRQWFHSRPTEWEEFERRYWDFLRENIDKLTPLVARAQKGTVTLIYASKNLDHNNAVALKKFMEQTG